MSIGCIFFFLFWCIWSWVMFCWMGVLCALHIDAFNRLIETNANDKPSGHQASRFSVSLFFLFSVVFVHYYSTARYTIASHMHLHCGSIVCSLSVHRASLSVSVSLSLYLHISSLTAPLEYHPFLNLLVLAIQPSIRPSFSMRSVCLFAHFFSYLIVSSYSVGLQPVPIENISRPLLIGYWCAFPFNPSWFFLISVCYIFAVDCTLLYIFYLAITSYSFLSFVSLFIFFLFPSLTASQPLHTLFLPRLHFSLIRSIHFACMCIPFLYYFVGYSHKNWRLPKIDHLFTTIQLSPLNRIFISSCTAPDQQFSYLSDLLLTIPLSFSLPRPCPSTYQQHSNSKQHLFGFVPFIHPQLTHFLSLLHILLLLPILDSFP